MEQRSAMVQVEVLLPPQCTIAAGCSGPANSWTPLRSGGSVGALGFCASTSVIITVSGAGTWPAVRALLMGKRAVSRV
eukprot:scaffold97154_cov32-Tisochrysis_lutea.AAC.4